MQDLKVIGVENGALLAASDDGERYRIAIDEVFQSRMRLSKPDSSSSTPKPSPREVQAHIRSGMSGEDVAAVTGASLEYVQRFEGPILAEREHIVVSALSVPVRTTAEVDPIGEGTTFGVVIRERLASLGVHGERWASWKEQEGGWIVKLSFTADQIDHDARWGYDARKHSLAPLNSEATTLSQQGELHGGLIPRLRAVTAHTADGDDSRFDSGAFTFKEPGTDVVEAEGQAQREAAVNGRHTSGANNSIAVSAIKRADDAPADSHQTADLLEALRRRRGEREAAGYDKSIESGSDSAMRIVDVPLNDFDSLGSPADEEVVGGDTREPAAATASSAPISRSSKRGRASMPSWDEIVFGARADDDPA
jgi:Protein of unknown function (DUF3071)